MVVEYASAGVGNASHLAAELFNSAIETLFKGLTQAAQDRVYPALDIAAGAVLMASITAAVVGAIVFGRRLLM